MLDALLILCYIIIGLGVLSIAFVLLATGTSLDDAVVRKKKFIKEYNELSAEEKERLYWQMGIDIQGYVSRCEDEYQFYKDVKKDKQ